MSRNSSGTYTLPAGNPVVTGTTITSTWGNTTMSDIANALTDSLSRSGLGSMTAGLRLFDGTSSLPGLTWGTELTSGMYRAGAADFRWVLATSELVQWTTNLEQISGTAPVRRWNESDAAANNRLWDIIASGEDLNFRVLTDALVATNWLTITRTAGVVDAITLAATTITSSGQHVFTATGSSGAVQINNTAPILAWFESDAAAANRSWRAIANGEQFSLQASADDFSTSTSWVDVNRTGTTIDTVNFANGTLQYGGLEVGYRGLTSRNFSGSDSTASTDNGKAVQYTGSGGHTFTGDGDIASPGLVTVFNGGSGTLTIAASGSLFWFNGSGTISSGSRTMAVGGVATMTATGGGNYSIWGTGLS